jgi:hypothetical protein
MSTPGSETPPGESPEKAPPVETKPASPAPAKASDDQPTGAGAPQLPAEPPKPSAIPEAAPAVGAIRPKVVRAGVPPTAGPKKPVYVVPCNTKRDFILTVIIVIVVVFVIALAVHKLGTDKSNNVLDGVVVEKYVAVPELGVSTKGVSDVDTGYHLRVKVGEHYYLLATLTQEEWNRYKVGDSIKFMKPVSEQR